MCDNCREATARDPQSTLRQLCAGFLTDWSDLSSEMPAVIIAATSTGVVIDGDWKDPIFVRKASAQLADMADDMDTAERESRANT